MASCRGVFAVFSFDSYVLHLDLHSFPTRRSSDLRDQLGADDFVQLPAEAVVSPVARDHCRGRHLRRGDRKSTRLNSSHTVISYAVFCLKKKIRSTEGRSISLL